MENVHFPMASMNKTLLFMQKHTHQPVLWIISTLAQQEKNKPAKPQKVKQNFED